MWNAISQSARKLGDKGADEAKKVKIKADILLIDRSIDARKRAFGVAMYDYLSPLSQSQDFYAASDKLTEIVRPILILAQKEIQALAAKRVTQKEALAKAEAHRAASFPTKAETYGQKLMNLGKAGYLHSGETKIKTELAVTDRLIKGHKEDFGVALYNAFAFAEDNEGFLPTDRQIRNVYDTCRQDLTVLEQKIKAKEDEIVELGGQRPSSQTPSVEQSNTTTSSTSTTASMTTSTGASTYNNNNNTSSGYSAPTTDYGASNTSSYGATTSSQSSSFGSTQVAGSGIFSHLVTSSGGYSDNAPSMPQQSDPFASMNQGYSAPSQGYSTPTQGYNAPSQPMSMNPGTSAVDPFSVFNSNPSTYSAPPSSSSQRNSGDLLDF